MCKMTEYMILFHFIFNSNLSFFHFHFNSYSKPCSQNWNIAHKNDSDETYYVQTEAVEVELLNDEMVRKMAVSGGRKSSYARLAS